VHIGSASGAGVAAHEMVAGADPARRGEDGTPSSFGRGGTMHELFASCVARHPDAVALVHRADRLTYSELDALSDHYAVALELAGVGYGDVVPVVMRRSPELVGLLLAVLKRGAAYSAMDPQWPAERLTALIARLHARLVVTEADGPYSGPWPVPAWTPPRYDPAAPARRPSPTRAGADDPCMILFTSGSTGPPKAVIAPHRGVVRLYDECEWMPAGPDMTMPQLSASSWDGFVVDCWGPLLTGGTTILVDDQILLPDTLGELRDRHGVNVVFLTPSLFNMLVEEGVRAFAGIPAVLIGGERASQAHARRFLEHHPEARLVNLYGPTECGVLVTAHDITVRDCASPDGIPLGRAVPYTGIHVLDGDTACDVGQRGEICLAGAGLAIGYLDDPEAMARSFAEVEVDGVRRRVYRTGDLGHWSSDRRLCFDGRGDLQVQVQGFRVEPAEIELAAAQVPGVTMPTVVPLMRDGEIAALALFYTSQQAHVSEAELRAELARQLPAYLVPSRIRRLDRLPVLTNGKLDRKLLEMMVAGTTGSAA
jgi:mycobactin peptide synthetase MbtE